MCASCASSKAIPEVYYQALDLQELRDRRYQAYSEIESLDISKRCVNANQCKSVAIGNKACGGPIGHFVYSTITGRSAVKKLEYWADQTRKIEREINAKTGELSNCAYNGPRVLVCEDSQCKPTKESALRR